MMKRRLAIILTAVMLWSGWLMPAGLSFAHIDSELGEVHPDRLTLLTGSTFKVGSKIVIEMEFFVEVACERTPKIILKHSETDDKLYISWVNQNSYNNNYSSGKIHYFEYTFSSTETEGVYYLDNFGDMPGNDNPGNCNKDQIESFFPGNSGYQLEYFRGLLTTGIHVDFTPPQVQSVTLDTLQSTFKAGDVIPFKVVLSEPAANPENLVLELNNGGTAVYKSMTGSTLRFEYTVQETDQNTDNLDVLRLSGTLRDAAGNQAMLPVNVSLPLGDPIIVDTQKPDIVVQQLSGEYAREHELKLLIDNENPAPDRLWVRYLWSQSDMMPDSSAITETGAFPGQMLPNPGNVNGDYFLYIRAWDIAGNETVKRFGPYKFDNEPPDVTFTPSEGRDNQAISVSVEASDSLSGVRKFTYQWLGYVNDPKDVYADSDVVPTPDKEGEYVLQVTAEDNVGNTKTFTSGEYKIDQTAPAIEFLKNGDETPAKTHQTNVRVTGAAGESGSVYYQWTQNAAGPGVNDPNWTVLHTGSYPMDLTVTTPGGLNGSWYLHVKAVDDVGNASIESTTGSFVLDNTAPEVGFSPNGNGGVYEQSTNVQLTIDGGNAFANYDVRYLISPDETVGGDASGWPSTNNGLIGLTGLSGVYYIHVRAVDQAGNETPARSQAFYLDVEKPAGSVTIQEEYTKASSVTIHLQATDNSDAPLEFRYRVNEDAWQEWLGFTPTETVQLGDWEGTQTIEVEYRDQAGNVSTPYSASIIRDTTSPSYASHTIDPEGWTNGSVTVTVNYTDNLSPSGTVTETFSENGIYTITFTDPAGNAGSKSIEISNIERDEPTIKITPNGSQEPKKTANAVVDVTDNVVNERLQVYWGWSNSQTAEPAEWKELSGNSVDELADENGQWYLWVRAIDDAGNVATEVSAPFLLDNIPPTATITYNPPTRTAMPVTATIQPSEDVTVINTDGGSRSYTFEDNGSFTFKFVDKAGNVGEATAVVNWIDDTLPTASVTATPDTWTNGDVIVYVSVPGNPPRELYDFEVDEHIAELISSVPGAEGGYTEATFRFTANGMLKFRIVDLETGVENSEQTFVVSNIDRTPPTGKLTYSHTDWTQDDVTVTLAASDDKSTVTYLNGKEYTFTTNGEHTFQFMDQAGNISELTAKVDFIDREAPQPFVTYSTTSWTRDTVTASVYFADASPVTILYGGGPEYTFHENGTHTLYFSDAAGNQGQVELKVDWIDREAPTGTLHYSTREWAQEVTVTLNASDNSGTLIYIAGGSEGGGVHKFTENGSYTFIVEDEAGNRSSFTAIVDRIDRTPPEAVVTYSITAPTNGNVRAVVTANEPVTVLNADGMFRDFTDNGTFTFEIADRAGNVTFVTAKVDWIDRTPPVPSVSYSTTLPTYQNVTATVSANEPFHVLNNNRSREYVFRENGTFTFYIQDLAGNVAEIEAKVDWIDKTPAAITLEYSETAPTQHDVTVTVKSDRALTFAGGAGPTVTFTKNGIVVLTATDDLGREYSIPIEVTNIDRTAPEIRFTEGDRIIVAQGGILNPLADVQAFDNRDGDLTSRIQVQHEIDTSVPGEYTIIYQVSDTAGNETSVVRTVQVMGQGSMAVYVNREYAGDGDLTIRASHVKLQWFGTQGEVKVRWAYGRLQLGEFKLIQETLPEEGLAIDRQGYYTFLVEDQELGYQLIHVYVIPVR